MSAVVIVTGDEWHEGRRIIDELRSMGYSWTTISKALALDPGWARSAYDSKHVMERRHLRLLHEELEKQPSEDRRVARMMAQAGEVGVTGSKAIVSAVISRHDQPATATSNGRIKNTKLEQISPRYYRTVAIRDELMGPPYYFKAKRIAVEVFGYSHDQALYTLLARKGDPGEERMMAAEAALLRIQTQQQQPHAPPKVEPVKAPPAAAKPRPVKPPTPPPTPAPAPALPKPKSAPAKRDAFSWMDDVRDGLLTLAERVEQEKAGVPAMFSAPYTIALDKLVALAEEFER